MYALIENLDGYSERLNHLLNKTKKFRPLGYGLTKEIKEVADVSYTTARKWLYEDTLPRTPEERIRVSDLLNVDLLYWEYGYIKDTKIDKAFESDHLFHMKMANQVMEIIHNEKLNIEPEKIIEIELIAFEVAKTTNCSNLNIDLLKSLIKLAS
jgi:hypothetical protein